MIEVFNLNKRYGRHQAICDLSFSVKKGSFVGLLGPNGAGKTTTLRILAGSLAPTSGSVRIDSEDIFEKPHVVKPLLGYLPDQAPLYDDLKVREYLVFVARLKGLSKQEAFQSADEYIEKISLKQMSLRPIGQLSRGFRQRVGIAQALVSRPKVVILDEPTIGLDPAQVNETREILRRLKGEVTLIFSSHILSEVQALCDEVVIIYKGKIRTQINISDISHQFSTSLKLSVKTKKSPSRLAEMFNSCADIVEMKHVDNLYTLNIKGGDSTIMKISEMVIESKAGLLELKSESKDLEEVFLDLTKED